MPRKGFNPFYALLVVVGVVFAVTATAYGVMTVRKLRHPQEPNPHPLIEALDEHGAYLLMGELAVLAAASVAAMATDSFWIRRGVGLPGGELPGGELPDDASAAPVPPSPQERSDEDPPPG